jgi:hypothetical protein
MKTVFDQCEADFSGTVCTAVDKKGFEIESATRVTHSCFNRGTVHVLAKFKHKAALEVGGACSSNGLPATIETFEKIDRQESYEETYSRSICMIGLCVHVRACSGFSNANMTISRTAKTPS